MEEFASMTIGELAEKSHTSNASIIRFCRKLGTKGYRDFRISLLREIDRRPEDSIEVDPSRPVYDRTSPVVILKNIADVHRLAVNACYTSVSVVDLQKAAFILQKADKVLLFGIGDSEMVARVFARRLARMGHFPLIMTYDMESLAIMSNITERDAALFISCQGNSIAVWKDAMGKLKKNECPTIILTSNRKVTGFDLDIIYPALENPEDLIATYYSTEAANYLLDVIHGIMFAMDYEKQKKNQQEILGIQMKELKKVLKITKAEPEVQLFECLKGQIPYLTAGLICIYGKRLQKCV
jgi:RpiR family carbohydrate utilization transcriptional regulator